jgi:hypothetical protein
VIRTENGEIAGIFPAFLKKESHSKILVSLPNSDIGGPLVKVQYAREVSFSLLEFMKRISRERNVSAAKISFLKDECGSYFKTSQCYVDDYAGVVELISVRPSAYIWEKVLRYSQRRKIKHFKKDGLNIGSIQSSRLQNFCESLLSKHQIYRWYH